MSFDRLVRSDLAALASESRKELRGVDDSLRSTDAYRDDRLGPVARRDELQARRRNELALMPLTLGHVFVHRVARAVAGAMALACAMGVLAMLQVRRLFELARAVMPINLALLIAIVAGLVLAAYVIASWIAEAVFARRMRRTIQPTGDPHADLDRFAEGPIEVGRRLVRRADAWAVGFAIAGSAATALVFGFLIYVLGATYSMPSNIDVSSALLDHPVRHNLRWIASATIMVGLVALAIAYACDREHRKGPSKTLAGLQRWVMVGLALILGGTTLKLGYSVARRMHAHGTLPSMETRGVLVGIAAFGLTLLATWVVLRWRRREDGRVAGCEVPEM
ncbi:MAG TPA: hypothetical protein VFQ53_14880 [Kofleriaceae bacterium]|nr:hypothetical protein [Kofleriaceae bacterium]